MTRIIFFLHIACALWVSAIITGCSDSNTLTDKHITATLVADHSSVSPGSAFTIGVNFTLEPGWHIYWKNPGDSGLPPRFSWSSSDDSVAIGAPLWPYPQRLATGPLVNYGYGDVLIPFPASLSSSAKGSAITVTVSLEWLVCNDVCLPGEGRLAIELPISNSVGSPSNHSKLFERAYEMVPAELERVSIAVEEQPEQIIVALIPFEPRQFPQEITFFPEDRRIISNSAAQEISRDGDSLRITLSRDPANRGQIERIRGVLVSPNGWSSDGKRKAVAIDTNPGAPAPEVAGPDTPDPTGPSSNSMDLKAPARGQIGFFVALLFAFVGGAILNLMPCVFPVLSIKVISFLEHSRHDSIKARRHGLAFASGVVVSFWILAAAISSVRVGGEQLGWGFQLQSPTFVGVMIVVFTVLGLLFLTQVTVGQTVQNLAGKWRLSTTYLGSFLSGALATAVATPCTAPFMSTALAATITLPTALTFLVFTALGCGMSAPYVLLSYKPNLLRFLPRPGAWMETFKQLMAFPLFASVVWLTRVFARQMGFEPPGLTVVTDLLWGLLALALAFWILTRTNHLKRDSQQRLSRSFAIVLMVIGIYIAIPSAQEVDESRARACAPSGEVIPFTDSHGLLWENYSEERLKKVVAQGRPVLLDFTAEWCITCQVNERIVFGSADVRELLVRKNVTLMRGDWTSKNPAITAALRRFGRSGVPLNVLLTSPASEPLVLPNILTPGIVKDALYKLPG